MKTKTVAKLWIGIDYHKKTWRVHFRSDVFSENPFSMEPNPDVITYKGKKRVQRL